MQQISREQLKCSNDTSLDDIVLAGELALCCLYGEGLHEWIGSRTNWTQKNGDGSKHGVDLNHEQQIYHLLQMIP